MLVASGLALALVSAHARDAAACGCFTPPDPSVPIVQAGERILFSMDNGTVTAHIQIQYAGNAQDFGWLLPLPSVPTLQLGTDELFANLTNTTQPKYRMVTAYNGNCSFNFGGRAVFNGSVAGPTAAGAAQGATADHSVLVIQDSIGPYDYAVLHADSQTDMLNWLSDNHYFVPAGTDQTVSAYIHPGAYFLALKLRSGKSAGDLQPVVVQYPSDLPMIPIVLTSVAAQPNMGIQVWMLGTGRAIPRNYYHTVINDAAIDWATAGQNYNDVIIKAVGEAPGKHSFVTEYAGSSSVMQKILNAPGRFGTQAALAASPDAFAFVSYLQSNGFTFTSQLITILSSAMPMPADIAAQGVAPSAFYQQLAYYRQAFSSSFASWPGSTYDPVALAQQIQDVVVTPTIAAGALFDKYPKLTRLYTTLSPQDMTLDPVFSFNATLPDVGNVHQATLTYYCGAGSPTQTPANTPAVLVTEQGWTRYFPEGLGPTGQPAVDTGVAGTERLEVLSEEGPPKVVMEKLPPSMNSGCACVLGGARGFEGAAAPLSGALLLAAAAALRLRRRGRR
jgi:hypothetical protein